MMKGLRAYYEGVFPLDTIAHMCTRDARYKLCDTELAMEWSALNVLKRHHTPADRVAYLDECSKPEYEGETLPLMFRDAAQLRAYLVKKLPSALHYGGVWLPNLDRTRERALLGQLLHPAPLVLDVDMDPRVYARTCRCGLERRVCRVCWDAHMKPALARATHVLRHLLGFERVHAFFSGRRGFHVWVLDDAVWELDAHARARIAETLARHGVHLDAEPTTQPGHLIKLPWSVHAVTGRVAVPILDTESFDPERAPHVDETERLEKMAREWQTKMSI